MRFLILRFLIWSWCSKTIIWVELSLAGGGSGGKVIAWSSGSWSSGSWSSGSWSSGGWSSGGWSSGSWNSGALFPGGSNFWAPQPSPAYPRWAAGFAGFAGLLLGCCLVCWFAAWPAAWPACCFDLAAFTRPSPDNQNPTKENARKIIRVSADNQTTKKAPKHVDVWVTALFFHIEETKRSRAQDTCAHKQFTGVEHWPIS